MSLLLIDKGNLTFILPLYTLKFLLLKICKKIKNAYLYYKIGKIKKVIIKKKRKKEKNPLTIP